MSYTREQALDALQRVMTGELAEDSDEFRAAAEAMPELREELRAMRSVQGALDQPPSEDAAEIAAEASKQSTDADRRLVAEALVPHMRRGWSRILLVAAMLAVMIFVVQWQPWRPKTGPLGPGVHIAIEQTPSGSFVTGLNDLPPGDTYSVLLYVDGERRAEQSLSSKPYRLPDEWAQLATSAERVELLIDATSMDAVRIRWPR